jgi:hypothetical protein
MLDKKVELLFLPPNGSALNPVERVWAIFKQQWAKRLAGLSGEIRPWEMEKEVSAVLKEMQADVGRTAQVGYKVMLKVLHGSIQ